MEPTEHTPDQPRPEPPGQRASAERNGRYPTSTRYGRPSSRTTELVRQSLTEMAGRLETNRPDTVLTAVGRSQLMGLFSRGSQSRRDYPAAGTSVTGNSGRFRRAKTTGAREAARQGQEWEDGYWRRIPKTNWYRGQG